MTPAELSKPEYNDQNWKLLKLNELIFPDSCWLKKVIELPKFIGGQPVEGKMKFLISVDDYGYCWINGKEKGHFPWNGEFELTPSASPGMKFVLLIKAVNTGGPLRLLRAKIDLENELPIRKQVRNFTLSLKAAQKLLSFDTYQTNDRVKVDPGIDKSKMDRNEKAELNNLLQSLAVQLDVNALKNGEIVQFANSLEKVKLKLKPISEYAKRFTLQFTANAHIDASWLWRKAETVEVCNRTFSSVMNMFEARLDFTYSQSQAVFYEWMQKLYPDLFTKIQKSVKDGRWEIVGGMWIEPDCNLPSGESWSRQMLYAQKYFEKNFGKKALIGWNPDSFGYNWNLPDFLINGGMNAFITQKIGWNDTNVFPYRVFWWQSPSGAKILTYFPFSYVNEILDPFGLVDWLRQFEANTSFTKLMILFGVGDHGGGPSLEMMERIDQLKELDVYPNIEFGTAENYISWLREQDLSKLPIWNNELYLEYHRGTLTTQSNIKKWNRESEVLLTNAEKFSSISSLFGLKIENADLIDAWKKVLFNQFHDILPGSSIREVYIDATKDYKEANEVGENVLNSSLEYIANSINTSKIKSGIPVVVFNPLSFERGDVASIDLPDHLMVHSHKSEYSIFTTDGKEIISQLIPAGKYKHKLIFIAENIPSLGYKTFILSRRDASAKKQKPTNTKNELTVTNSTLENKFFRITIDKDSGWIKSIFDKRYEREILNGYGNRLQLLEDKPREWDAWNIGLTGVEFPSTFRKIEIVEKGPVRIVLRVYRDYLKPGTKKWYPTEDFPSSFFIQDIILYDGVDRIDFRTNVDWWEEKTMLKVAFPVSIENEFATYEIPYGTIQRSTTLKAQWDKGKWEVAGLRWGDLSNNDYGISLLNKAKYGYDIKGNVIRLSLLRSPKWPDPTADRGEHFIEYSIYPHSGNCLEGKTLQQGYQYNFPLITFLTDLHKGALPSEKSFVKISPPNVILTSTKKSDDESNAWILQLYESKGSDCELTINLPFIPKNVYRTNFLEEEQESLTFKKNMIKIQLKANEIVTIKVSI